MNRMGFKADVVLETKLLTVYAKSGRLTDARRVLDEMPNANVVSWTAMIAAYAKHGHAEEALKLFSLMQRTGIRPDPFAFVSVLPACANMESLELGKEAHEDIIRSGFQSNIFVGSSVVDMYVKCGSIEDARKVFDKMPERNVVSWTAMIAGYAQNGHVDEAFELFEKMPRRDLFSWNVMIAGYAQNGQVDDALELFRKMPERDTVSWNAMITGFAENGYIVEALKLFNQMPERDVVSWNAMITGYTKQGSVEEALRLFCQMQQSGIQPNQISFASVLPAFGISSVLEDGKEVHEEIIRRGYEFDIFVGNALVDMYAKCRNVGYAQKVFDRMPKRNVVSWNAVIGGYTHNGLIDEAMKLFQRMPERNAVSWTIMIAGCVHSGHFDMTLELFLQMQLTGVRSDWGTFASVLSGCANMGALQKGKEVHENIVRSGIQFDVFVGSALVDMYAKCGRIDEACKVFDEMPRKDVVSWSAMVLGFAMHGHAKEALQLFEQMQHLGMEPNHVTFIGILSACCHADLVDKGLKYFDYMSRVYHITPEIDHYCCMVDLLGRAGCLDEAEDFINRMPIKPNIAIWGSLLASCRKHFNIELGERVAEHVINLDPTHAAHYVLLSNIYAEAGRWDDIEKVRKMMKDRNIKKMPGCSWIELKSKTYTFLTGDKSHPQTPKIYSELEKLSGQMKEAGYVSNTDFVLHDVEGEQKEHILCHHSEKLAISFGLINTSPGTPIRIIKNLRVCGDCHSAISFISKIAPREIVVRDASRFHHFKNGKCSCGDYW
jgi:pentatricopeptide repeat protein